MVNYLNNKRKDKSLKKILKINNIHLFFTSLLAISYIVAHESNISLLSVISFVLLTILAVNSDINKLTYLLYFFSPMFLFVVIGPGFPYYNVIIILIFFRRILQGNYRNFLFPYICLNIIIIIELIGLIVNLNYPSLNMIKLFMIIFITLLHLVDTKKGFDSNKAMLYFIIGTSIFAGASIFDGINTVVSDSNRSGGLGELDPNTYGLYNIIAISIILQKISMKGIKNIFHKLLFFILALIIFIAGFMTLSKTYAIISVFMVILYSFINVKSIKKFLVTVIGIAITIVFLLKIKFFNEILLNLLTRFTMADSISELTTGRSDIYSESLRYISENLNVFFIGEGMYSYYTNIPFRPHNSILEIILSWGIIGLVLFLLMFTVAAFSYKKNIGHLDNIHLLNFVPLIIFLIYMQSLTLMYQEATYAYITIVIMVLFNKENKNNSIYDIQKD